MIVELEAEGTENAHPTLILFLSFLVPLSATPLFQELNVGIKNYGTKLYIINIELQNDIVPLTFKSAFFY